MKRNTRKYFKGKFVSDVYVTLTDIKNWLYCPRVVYYNRVLDIRPLVDATQQSGREFHKDEIRRMIRRKGISPWERRIILVEDSEVELYSKRLRLLGVVDVLAMNENGEMFPVEIKYMGSNKGKAWLDHRYQVIGQALLVEENYLRPVKRAYIYYHKDRRIVKIAISVSDREYVKSLVRKILEMIITEREPVVRVPRGRCSGGCGYRWVCGGYY